MIAILRLRIDPASSTPIYTQIIDQIRYQIATGSLKANDELQSVRALAKEHLISPNTVARAYLELERDGDIYKRRGMGTYVAEKEGRMELADKIHVVEELIEKALEHGQELGLVIEPGILRRGGHGETGAHTQQQRLRTAPRIHVQPQCHRSDPIGSKSSDRPSALEFGIRPCNISAPTVRNREPVLCSVMKNPG